jgi:nitroreductase
MDFMELAEYRYSVRTYKPDPVPDDLLARVLEAARLAPTADNRQPFRLIVIRTAGRAGELRRIYNRDWFVQAPLIVGIVTVPAEAWVRADGKNYADVDAAIVMDHLILAAAEAGLGTCWIGAFNVSATREVLGLPPDVEPLAFTPLGFPAEEPGFKRRRSLEELVRYERW